ncbi:Transcription termination factor MTERF5 [Durusdinium trenchii]|uniref:Chloroplastic (Mitochondrial transcription termination factor 5) (mTERF5) (Protein MTERF DEFECTIVE IN ARABIDOPSIS 1) n=1 Tax=Durusdinium trenchii TaxID=1381693 RepID=A0ABP0SBN5_9DINO
MLASAMSYTEDGFSKRFHVREPMWWQRGWPRQRFGTVAEAALLSKLAEVLMPKKQKQELFRSFPSPDGLDEEYLEPDLVAYGLLKDPDAALFVEYDGDVDRAKRKSKTKDQKNQALLKYGPPGSCVLRISHTHSSPLKDQVLEIRVCPWQPRNTSSLQSTLSDTLTQTSQGLEQVLSSIVAKRLSRRASKLSMRLSRSVEKLGKAQIVERITSSSHKLGCNCKQNLKPIVQWLVDMGLTEQQVANVIAKFPRVLRFSIDQNLKPTVQWLLDIGLGQDQVVKAIVTYPRILCLSIEKNLKPKQTLLEAAIEATECADLISRFPRIFSYSYQRLSSRLRVLAERNETHRLPRLVYAMTCTEDGFKKHFEHSSG